MFKKNVIIGMILIMGLGLFSGCSGLFRWQRDKTADDQVVVTVKAEYRENFAEEGFTFEDFTWDNIDKIVYGAWSASTDTGRLVVYLKQHGNKHVKKAVKHFKSLDFVTNAEPLIYDLKLD